MLMNVRDDLKIVEIWLTNPEKNDPVVRESLKPIYARYKKEKYLVGVFESGEGDLYDDTLALLSYNRKLSAQKEVQQEKEALGTTSIHEILKTPVKPREPHTSGKTHRKNDLTL